MRKIGCVTMQVFPFYDIVVIFLEEQTYVVQHTTDDNDERPSVLKVKVVLNQLVEAIQLHMLLTL